MRSNVIQTRVNEEEKELIQANAARCGMSISDYLRSAATGQQVREIGNLRELMAELCRLYTTVNQMEESEEKEILLERMDRVCRQLRF